MELHTQEDLKLFYNNHYRNGVQQAYRILNDLAIAEDVVQECIVKLWRFREEISSKGSVLHYFRRMIRNACIDLLRKKSHAVQDALTDEIAVTPPDALEFAELSKSIDALIDGLPEKCRQIFVLSRFEEMTYREISEELNISVKTVETQISRALKAIRKGIGYALVILFFHAL